MQTENEVLSQFAVKTSVEFESSMRATTNHMYIENNLNILYSTTFHAMQWGKKPLQDIARYKQRDAFF